MWPSSMFLYTTTWPSQLHPGPNEVPNKSFTVKRYVEIDTNAEQKMQLWAV
jgi:hypothetical protein